jgi:putative hydrolase of the HAD superfamily
MPDSKFKLVLSDIGGVLGTNGWDSNVRRTICRHFDLIESEIADRHRLMFDSYERGYMTFEEYLRRVFFGSPRPFSIEQVRDLAYAQSVPWPENIAFFRKVKQANSVKLGLISNEGEGITAHRVEAFNLRELADFMIISHCVHMRKPDRDIWQLALDLTQVMAADTIYIDDRAMFVDVAAQMGFTAIQHVSLEGTAEQFNKFGLLTSSGF